MGCFKEAEFVENDTSRLVFGHHTNGLTVAEKHRKHTLMLQVSRTCVNKALTHNLQTEDRLTETEALSSEELVTGD